MRRVFVSVSISIAVWAWGGAASAANSLKVAPAADRPDTYHLELRIDDPALTPAAEAWVGFGEEKGLRQERSLIGRFRVDPAELTLPTAGHSRLHFLWLRGGPAEAGGTRFFLERDGDRWLLGAQVWDQHLGRYALVGAAPLNAAAGGRVVEFEWRSASRPGATDGALSVSWIESDGSRSPQFSNLRLENGADQVSLLQLGIAEPSLQPAGASGLLILDDFALYRGSASGAARP